MMDILTAIVTGLGVTAVVLAYLASRCEIAMLKVYLNALAFIVVLNIFVFMMNMPDITCTDTVAFTYNCTECNQVYSLVPDTETHTYSCSVPDAVDDSYAGSFTVLLYSFIFIIGVTILLWIAETLGWIGTAVGAKPLKAKI